MTYTGDISLSGPRNPRHLSAIENMEGHVVIAGTCDTREKGSDITVQIVSKRGDLIAAYLFGGLKDDGAYSIVATPDGGYVLAGYTDSKWSDSKGGRDAFLLKISRFGIPLWHHVSGTSGDDEWRQVVVLSPSGDLIVGGYYGAHPAMMSITAEGKVSWERTWVQLNAGINTIGLAGENIFFAGVSGQKPKTGMFIGTCDLSGILQGTKIIDEHLEATSLLTEPDGHIIIAGNTFAKGRRTDGVIIRINSGLDILAHKVFGGHSDDKVYAATALPGAGGYAITGHSFSMSKGARRADIWVEALDRDFRLTTLKERYFGNSQEDLGFTSVVLTDNTLWTVGSSHPGIATAAETRVVRFNLPADDAVHDPAALTIAGVEPFRISGEDSVLDSEEFGYFTLQIKNNSGSRSAPARIMIHTSDPDLMVPDSLIIPSIAPGEIKSIYLPFSAGKNIPGKEVELILSGLSDDISLSVPVRQLYRPEISMVDFSFQKDEEKDEVELTVRLINEGNGYLSQGACYFNTNFKVGRISTDEVIIDNIAPRQETEVIFTFVPLANYNEDSVTVHFVLRSDEASVLLRKELTYRILEEPAASDTISGITHSPEPEDNAPVFQTAVWMRPDPVEQGYKIEHLAPEIDIRLRVISSVPLHPDSLYLTNNGVAALPGVTYEPGSAQLVRDYREAGYQYTYTHKIHLLVGENIVRLAQKNSHEPLTASPMVIDYIPKRYDLHVFAIGIPQEDLRFTAKDARDFAEAFQGQSGKLFREVNIHLRNTSEATTTSALRFAVQDIANDYYIREKINRDDMIMVYISSHGFQLDGQEDKFKIAASDFNWLYKSQTSLDFREDILDVLSSLPCKKLLLLDACYSGAIADIVRESGRKGPDDPSEIALSRAIARLVESQNDFQVITSSGPGQRSYEDEAWGNSAFMLGLLEAMGRTPGHRPTAKADPDGDSILYLSEIYEYIKTRIPEIVLTKKPRPADIQTPWMIAWEEWPVFVF